MAVKDRTKPIQHIETGIAATYLGPVNSLGLNRNVIQMTCDRTLVTAWMTDEDFERSFENVPEPDKTYVNPLKAIRLRADAWTDRALERVDQVHCIVRCIRNGETWCDVKIMWKDGRTDVHPIKASDLYDAFENVPEESPVASECDNRAAPKPHEGNGEFQPEIDWKGEVECRLRDSNDWRPFRVVHWCEEFPDQVYGTRPGQALPYTYHRKHFEFRNKPEPEPKWESAGDDRPIDCQRKVATLWLVWVQWPDAELPTVAHANPSRLGALGFQADLIRHGLVAPGTRFAIAPCKAPVMPEAAEVGA